MEAIKTIQDLIECYKKLPGIGFKTAERLAYATLHLTAEDRNRFILALTDANEKVQKCPKCGNLLVEKKNKVGNLACSNAECDYKE